MGSPTSMSAEDAANAIGQYATGLAGVNQPVNLLFKDVIWWSLGTCALLILTIRLGERAWSHLRQASAMSLPGDKQTYWKYSQWSWMPSLKKHFIYAPMFRKRRNREIRLSSAINMGTLPSRLQAILLFLYLGSNIVYCLWLDWSNSNRWSFLAELRGRTGTLAAVNMVPLIIMAGRNNPMIQILRINFDTYNLLHRWLGRIVVLEALVHTIAWAVVQVAAGGWDSVWRRILHDDFIASGTVGTLAFLLIFVLSVSPLRHAFYETFLNVHIILAAIVFICTWIHCAAAELTGGLPQLPWIIAIVFLWAGDRFARAIRMGYFNRSKHGWTEAEVEPMPGQACRVTFHLPRYVDIKSGSHAYLRFLTINPWESHPFSIAWVEHKPIGNSLPIHEKDDLMGPGKDRLVTSVSFVIGAQTGFTRKLYNRAVESGKDKLRLSAIFEGPYAGHQSIDSYGHAVLFAGGTGITHQMSYLRPLIEGFAEGRTATRRATLVWVIRDFEALEWIRPWMDEILRLPGRREVLNIRLFVTRPRNPAEIRSQSATVQMSPGRPNIQLLLEKEVLEQQGAMYVSVCGPGHMSDDVSAAVRTLLQRTPRSSAGGSEHCISAHIDSFTW